MSSRPSPLGAEGVVLHPVELDAGTVASLNSMLKLLDARTQRAWRIQADAGAPVYITHTGSDFVRRTRSTGPGRSGGQPAPQLLVVYEIGDAMPPETFRLQRPFRVAAVLEVLERLDHALTQGSAGAKRAAVPSTAPAASVEPAMEAFQESGLDSFLPSAFDGMQGEFAIQLAALLADPGEASVLEGRYADGSKLIADPAAAVFFADRQALDHLQAGRLPDSAERRIGAANRASVRRSLPIGELVWCTALASAASDSLRAPDPGTALELVRWPPFGHLDGSRRHFRLAAALVRQPMALDRLIQASGVEAVVAERFVAAGLFAGFVRAGNTRSAPRPQRPADASVAALSRFSAAPQGAPQSRKIVFTGSEGAGKTTAIRAVSEVQGIDTEVTVSGPARGAKASTTVAMDYGQAVGADRRRLMLYGTPGQQRFAFMWKVAAKGADGVVILIDNAAADPLGDLRRYLDGFAVFGRRGAVVIGIGRTESHVKPTMKDHASLVAAQGWRVPVLAVDARDRADVQLMLDLLCLILDAAGVEGQS